MHIEQYKLDCVYYLKEYTETRQMAHWLRVFVAFSCQNLHSCSKTSEILVLQNLMSSSDLIGLQACIYYTHIQSDKKFIHKKEIIFFKFKNRAQSLGFGQMGVVLGGVNHRSVIDMFEIHCIQKINKLFLRGNASLYIQIIHIQCSY